MFSAERIEIPALFTRRRVPALARVINSVLLHLFEDSTPLEAVAAAMAAVVRPLSGRGEALCA
jgi:hypothetical protein